MSRNAHVTAVYEFIFEDIDDLFGADLSEEELREAITDEVSYLTNPDHIQIEIEEVEEK